MFVMISYYDAMKTNDNDVATDAFDVHVQNTKAFLPLLHFSLCFSEGNIFGELITMLFLSSKADWKLKAAWLHNFKVQLVCAI